MAQSIRSSRSRQIYRQLWEPDEGFAQVNRTLNEMRSVRGFHTAELARYSALAAEARAATLAFVLEVLGNRSPKKLADCSVLAGGWKARTMLLKRHKPSLKPPPADGSYQTALSADSSRILKPVAVEFVR
jgi:hypothetical protein